MIKLQIPLGTNAVVDTHITAAKPTEGDSGSDSNTDIITGTGAGNRTGAGTDTGAIADTKSDAGCDADIGDNADTSTDIITVIACVDADDADIESKLNTNSSDSGFDTGTHTDPNTDTNEHTLESVDTESNTETDP